MAGLSLNIGGFGGVASGPSPTYGTQASYPSSATQAAFGPGWTSPAPSAADYLSPMNPIGLSIWVGIAAVVGLYAIRQSLPN